MEYIILNTGDEIKDGDERWGSVLKEWFVTGEGEGLVEHGIIYRRPVENELTQLRAELATLIAEVKKLKAHLSPDGEYAIRRADGGAMFITETMLLGDIMDNIDAMLEWDVTPKELSTPDPQ